MRRRRFCLTNNATRVEQLHRSGPRPTCTASNLKSWYQINNLTNVGQAEVYIYDEIGLWGVTAADFVRDLQTIDAVTIELHINSPGGDVWDGIAIYNALCNHPASVLSYVDGIAASAASFIAQAGGKVSIARNGTMMIHDAEGICIGNAADMTEMADLLDKASNNIADIYAQRCSTVLQWRKAMKATSWYVGQEAVDAGLADEAYEPDPGTDDAPAERRRKATNIQPVVIQRLPADTDVSGDIPTPDNVDANDDGAEGGEEGEATTTTTTTTTEPSEESNTDALAWWNPEVFRVAMATAADQHRLYGFDPEAFREIMRAASENCPAPPEVKLEETPLPIGPPILDGREFLTAIRRGLL